MVYRVLIASPGDVQTERLSVPAAINDWNIQHSSKEGVVFIPIKSETHSTPAFGGHPQEILIEQFAEVDVVIAIFKSRLGLPTGRADSGTIQEIETYLAKGKEVMLFFSTDDVPQAQIDTSQYRKLKTFKDKVMKQGIKGVRGLIQQYKKPDELVAMLPRHLSMLADKLKQKVQQAATLPTTLAAFIRIGKRSGHTQSPSGQGGLLFAARVPVFPVDGSGSVCI